MQATFKLKRADTKFGQNVYIVGNCPTLKTWNPNQALQLHTDATKYPEWTSQQPVSLEAAKIEYKYIIKASGGQVIWEDGANRQVDLSGFAPNSQI